MNIDPLTSNLTDVHLDHSFTDSETVFLLPNWEPKSEPMSFIYLLSKLKAVFQFYLDSSKTPWRQHKISFLLIWNVGKITINLLFFYVS